MKALLVERFLVPLNESSDRPSGLRYDPQRALIVAEDGKPFVEQVSLHATGTESRTVPPKDRDRADWLRRDNAKAQGVGDDQAEAMRSLVSLDLGTRLGTQGRDKERGAVISVERRLRRSVAAERPFSSSLL